MMIGGLFAKLSLNSASFEKGVKRARSTMFRLAKDMAVMSTAAAAGGAALGAMGMAAVSSAREIQRLSQVAGASPRELQRWSAATKTVGIDQEKLADILKDVNDRVGDFVSTGGGPMADFFENIAPKVGVTADQFAKLSGPEALQLYVDSLQKANLNQKEMTFYMEAMASDSTLLLPLLRDNAAELERLGDAAEKAGGIMSDADVKNLAKAGQAFDRLRASATGMRNVLAAKLAPTMEKLAGVMEKAMQKGGALRKVFDFLGENAGRITSYVAAAGAAFGAYASAVVIATAVTQGFKRALVRTGIGALVVGLGEAVYQFTALKKVVGSTAETFAMFKDLAKGAVNYAVEAFVWFGNRIIGVGRGAIGALKIIFGDFPTIMKAIGVSAANGFIWAIEKMINGAIFLLNKFTQGVNYTLSLLPEFMQGDWSKFGMMGNVEFGSVGGDAIATARATGKQIGDAFVEGLMTDTRKAVKVFDVPHVKDQWNKIQDIIKSSNKETENITKSATKLDGAFSGLGPAAEEAAGGVGKVAEAAQNAQSQVGQLRDMFATTFASIVTRASSAKEAVSGLLSRFADMAANNAFQGLWNGTIGASMSGGGMSWLGTAANWLFGSVGANANGTPSWKGGLTTINERGQELVDLPRGSKVYDAQRSKRMMDGANGQLTIQLGDGLKADWLGEAGNQSIQIVQSGIEQYDSQMPARVNQIAADSRRR